MYAYTSVHMSQGPGRINPVTGKLGDKRRRVSLRGGVLGGVIKYDDVLLCLVGRTIPNKRGHESSADIGGRLVGLTCSYGRRFQQCTLQQNNRIRNNLAWTTMGSA